MSCGNVLSPHSKNRNEWEKANKFPNKRRKGKIQDKGTELPLRNKIFKNYV